MKKWLLLLCLASTLPAAAQDRCPRKGSRGTGHPAEALDKVLGDHQLWVKTNGAQGARGDLSGWNLQGKDLHNRTLRGIDLSGANLSEANLAGADLSSPDPKDSDKTTDLTGATLCGAILVGANLNGAYLGGGDLIQSGADLRGACLRGADLTNADLTNADLSELLGEDLQPIQRETPSQRESQFPTCASVKDLTKAGITKVGPYKVVNQAGLLPADLRDAILKDTQFEQANLEGALYQPGESPEPELFNAAHNLDSMIYVDNPRPIVTLRKALEDAGFEQEERQVNRAYHSAQETRLERVFFDWTCAWGADALRPLEIIAALSGLCTLIYWIGMHFRLKRSGLYMIAKAKPVAPDGAKERVSRIAVKRAPYASILGRLGPNPGRRARSSARRRWLVSIFRTELKALSTALLFSLMSAFNIGFEGFNPGLWIRMLQPREFDLKAGGWMRTVSGLQSLIGAGLIALSVLSYFGHPFE